MSKSYEKIVEKNVFSMKNEAIIPFEEGEMRFHLQTKNPAVLKDLNKYTHF
jgi:hypothetical protein